MFFTKPKVYLLFSSTLLSSDSLNVEYTVIEHSDYYNKNNDSSGNTNSNIEKVGNSSWGPWEWNIAGSFQT